MSIVLDGNGAITGLTATGISAVQQLPAGSVLQVVQGTYNTYSTSTSTSYIDSGLTASITPKSTSSKILVVSSMWFMIAGNAQGMDCGMNIVRNSTQIWESLNQAINVYNQGSATGVEFGVPVSLNYLDSPATTSSTTYKIQVKKGNGSEIRWRSGTIILMEIAA